MAVNDSSIQKPKGAPTVTLVVGANGATGRHVVHQLLQQGRSVHVIVRSKERMLEALIKVTTETNATSASTRDDLLQITEASLLDLSDRELQEYIHQVENVVCCLGHTLTFQGVFGQPRRLVTDSVQRLTRALAQTQGAKRKLILMNSNGVEHPSGSDDRRGFWDRTILWMLRRWLPPHADNEAAAAYLYSLAGTGNMEWVVLRPTNLIDGPVSNYKLYDKPIGSLFGSGVVTRANVAKCMVDLITNESLFETYKLRMPVVHDATQPSKAKRNKQA